jgi:hypothetical protein
MCAWILKDPRPVFYLSMCGEFNLKGPVPQTRRGLRPAHSRAMEEVRATLKSWNLSHYSDAFFEEGYDDLAYLKTLGEDALQRVAESVGMKPGALAL